MELVFAFLIVLMIASLVALACCGLMLLRNNWVYRRRIELIETNYAEYASYLDYQEMLRKWWIWDVEKLRKQATK